MPPKKAAAETSNAPAEELLEEDQKTDVIKPVKKVSPHPSTMEMVKEALTVLDQRKGVSAQAIRTFIKEKYRTVDEMRLKTMVRKALVKGIDSGAFVRPASSSTTTGAQGRFRLAVRKPKAVKSKEVKENVNPNVKEAKEKLGDVKTKKGTSAAVGETKPKRAKKNDSSAPKVAPAKKPKAKRAAGAADDGVPEPKIQKASKASKGEEAEEKSNTKKGGKKVARKTPGDPDAEGSLGKKGEKKEAQKPEEAKNAAEATVPKKGGKKTPQKAADDGGEQSSSKSSGKKSKKGSRKITFNLHFISTY
ncbi:Protein B4 [Bagarius yarrelli]|uniref:Protein B4 n=1 Tax=Bagarius yarrelli TaxID=175774 RepID=A0A556VXG7_BAGYA|nr:Protein B4 [Bagarius yarrelli]